MKKDAKEKTIGERIKEVFDKSGMTVTQFAELLHCDRSNVNNIFRRKKIDIYLLINISKILNHNFVEEICAKQDFSVNMSCSKISLVLDIKNIDAQTVKMLLKIIKQLEKSTVHKTKNSL